MQLILTFTLESWLDCSDLRSWDIYKPISFELLKTWKKQNPFWNQLIEIFKMSLYSLLFKQFKKRFSSLGSQITFTLTETIWIRFLCTVLKELLRQSISIPHWQIQNNALQLKNYLNWRFFLRKICQAWTLGNGKVIIFLSFFPHEVVSGTKNSF